MAVDVIIQTDVEHNNKFSATPCIDSDGRIYVAYSKNFAGTEYLTMGYSDDGGQTWTDVQTALNTTGITAAIDSNDIVHVIYARNTTILGYRTFSNNTWSAEEIIHDGTGAGDDIQAPEGISLAIDGSNFPHVAWCQEGEVSSAERIYYSTRSSGSWSARLLISDTNEGAGETENDPRIVIHSDGDIHIIWRTEDATDALLNQAYYDGVTWSSSILVDDGANGIDYIPWPVVDSDDNVHVVYLDENQTPDALRYIKYTKQTNSWSAPVTIENTNVGANSFPTMGIDDDDNLYVAYRNTSNSISLLTYTGSWSASSIIIDGSATDEQPTFHTPLFPKLEGLSTSRPTTGYYLVYFVNTTTDTLNFFSSTGMTLVTPLDKNYSRKNSAALPSNDSNLTNLFTATDYGDVASDNNVYVSQTATNEYTIQQFKNKAANSSDEIHVSWRGKSSLAPSSSAVVLQIYNRSSGSWETLTSNSTTPADTEFTLTASKTTNLNQYYDGNNWVSFRVYQLAQ